MSSDHRWNSIVAGSGGRLRPALAVVLVVTMLLSAVPLFSVPASSDPWYGDDGDMTRNVLWNFTDPADYLAVNASISEGLGTLELVNATIGENTAAGYALGTGTNVDMQAVPDSIVIDNASLPVQTLILQPGTEGMDNYMDEWFPYWSPPNGSDLNLNGNYDPDPASSKRAYVVMQFNLSLVPAGSTIRNATLLLYEKSGKGPVLPYTIHALNVSWNEVGVSWRTRDAWPHGWDNPGGDYSLEVFSSGVIDSWNGWHSLDLTRLVDLWTRGATPNNGFVIVSQPTLVDSLKTFTDCEVTNKPEQRPILRINYTLGTTLGVFDSQALGHGLNSTITSASWDYGVFSRATDEFDAGSLSQNWLLLSDPRAAGGSLDFSTPGWLNITGTAPTDVGSSNFLYQDITGNFRFDTSLSDRFADDPMGAGILLRQNNESWIALYKTGIQGAGSIVAEVSSPGNDTVLGAIPWTSANATLRMERIGQTYSMFASTDGTTWSPVAGFAPQYDFTRRVAVGLCLFSGGSSLRPEALFDYARIGPLGQTTDIEVRARTGNSTLLTDPSWTSWTDPLVPSSGAVIGLLGLFVQYQVTMSTSYDWFSPQFEGFECHLERYFETGTLITGEVSPPSLASWQSMTATQTVANGLIEYSYSVDHGSTWVDLGAGTTFSIPLAQPSIMIRVSLTTYDTLTTPSVDSIELVYSITHARFYVSAPQTVTAGQQFSVYIEPKDTSNGTAAWSGDVDLVARDASGLSSSSAGLYVVNGTVPTSGHLSITNERYDVAETITIYVSGGGAWGISNQITVLPGTIHHILMEPNVTRLPEDNSTVFTASGYDAFGNLITGSPVTWHADPSLGFLNRTTGPSVFLTTTVFVSGGYLNVTIQGLTLSRYIEVSPLRLAPQIDPEIPRIQTKPEDFGSWTFDISPYVSDREDSVSNLKWYIVNATLVTVIGENRTGDMTITFTTIRDVFGTEAIELRVVDTDRMMARVSLTVNITPVNDPPRIDAIDPLVVRYEDPYAFDLEYYVHDVDTPAENLTITVDSASAPYVSLEGLWMTINYPRSLNGTQQTVLMTVSDGSLQAEAYIVVTISDDYVPRTRGALPNLEMLQGEVVRSYFDLDDYFTDPDGDLMIYTYGNTHVGVLIQPNNTVDFYAPSSWYGDEYVLFRANDSAGAWIESAMTVTVIAVNQPPVISGVPDILVRYGEEYVFDLSPYVRDPDNANTELTVTTNDSHIWADGLTLTMLYPTGMTGLKVPVNITVGDGELYDFWVMNVTISSDRPPVIAIAPPNFSFYEDEPVSYPEAGHINDFFSDPDGDPLVFFAFTSSPNVTAMTEVASGNWTVAFDPDENWNGLCQLTLRAADDSGGLVEATVDLIVISVPDRPVLSLPDAFSVTEGSHTILDITKNVADPDSVLADFRFTVSQEYAEFVTIHSGVIVFEFPKDYLEDEESRDITISITVFDQDNLFSADTMIVTVNKAAAVSPSANPILWLALIATAAAATVFLVFAIIRRKKPFVVRDMMVIHNDGFLISRLAKPVAGEIDDQVLSGMLTAVLNFVEDSMAKKRDSLTTFGFREYQVLVQRGEKAFAAVVFEGDQPEGIEGKLDEFINKFDRIYRKKLADWSGDVETDFAGADVLIQGWVRDNSKRAKDKKADAPWKTVENGSEKADTDQSAK